MGRDGWADCWMRFEPKLEAESHGARWRKSASASDGASSGDLAQGATPGTGAGAPPPAPAGRAASGQDNADPSHWPAPRPLPLPLPLAFGLPWASAFSRQPGVLHAMWRWPQMEHRCRKPAGQISSMPVQRPALKSKQAPVFFGGPGCAGAAGCAGGGGWAGAAASSAPRRPRPRRDLFQGGSSPRPRGGGGGVCWAGVKPSKASTTASAAAGRSSRAGLQTCLSHHHCRAPSSK